MSVYVFLCMWIIVKVKGNDDGRDSVYEIDLDKKRSKR